MLSALSRAPFNTCALDDGEADEGADYGDEEDGLEDEERIIYKVHVSIQ